MRSRSGGSSGSTVVTVSGSIDTVEAMRLRRTLSLPRLANTNVVLDLSKVTFLGMDGLAVLADAAARLVKLAVVIDDCPAQVLYALEQACLQPNLRMFDTVEHALAVD